MHQEHKQEEERQRQQEEEEEAARILMESLQTSESGALEAVPVYIFPLIVYVLQALSLWRANWISAVLQLNSGRTGMSTTYFQKLTNLSIKRNFSFVALSF